MRRAGKVDANQHAIIDVLLAANCKVQTLAAMGGGVPDLLVQRPDGTLLLMEVKAPDGTLTPLQTKWMRYWPGVRVVRSPDEALIVVAEREGE